MPEFLLPVVELVPSPQSMLYVMLSPSGSVVMAQYVYKTPVLPFCVPEGAEGVTGGWLDTDAALAITTVSEGDHAETFPLASVALTFTAYVPACVQAWLAEAVMPEFLLPVVELVPLPQSMVYAMVSPSGSVVFTE